MLEISGIIKDCLIAYRQVDKWAKPEAVPFDLKTHAMGGKVIKDPQGVALIIGPFNYPLVSLFIVLLSRICCSSTSLSVVSTRPFCGCRYIVHCDEPLIFYTRLVPYLPVAPPSSNLASSALQQKPF